MADYLAEVEAGERGGLTLARGPVGVLVNWAATSTQVRIKQTNKQNNINKNKQTKPVPKQQTNKHLQDKQKP